MHGSEDSLKGINHLVLAARDMDALRQRYERLGFTLTPRAQHPFGTGNSVAQLHGSYLELLSVTQPENVPEPQDGAFSFAAFNRDFLAKHEGFSMLVLDTPDAAADRERWANAGLRTYAPFDFSRMAKKANGEEVRVGFALAFTSHPDAPWLGLFSCQHFAPDYFEQPEYLRHANGALGIADVWISGDGALDLAGWLEAVTGAQAVTEGACKVLTLRTGRIVLAPPDEFEAAFRVRPPNARSGPHLAGYTVRCGSLGFFDGMGLERIGERLVVRPEDAFGTALGFGI